MEITLPTWQPTLIVFYWAYLLAVLFFIIVGIINIYHLLKFGFFSWVNILVITAFVAIASFLIYFSLVVLVALDWSRPLFDVGIVSGLFSF